MMSINERWFDVSRGTPALSEWDALIGPFYDADAAALALGTCPRLLPRERLIETRTSDGHCLYPAWQFQDRALYSEIVELKRQLAPATEDGWTIAWWMKVRRRELNNFSVYSWIRAARGLDIPLDLARAFVAETEGVPSARRTRRRTGPPDVRP
ncbi:hypothetical protein QQX13_12150 [Demequina sp. SYSU T00068]|uniref:hypothetical protein n=1 Tax=Demequina lignilytica TaxID=3051663 RepID=UPI0026351EFC|nr:hypothetical protein [Demequina sp. SYSU T00068]MDN4491586.1 hypothetical protein [Demequina sp. SYSU T00068]